MNHFKIEYIPQPDFSSCDEACLAMIAQVPIEEAISVMKGKRGSGSSHFYRAFKKYKIDYLSWRTVDLIDEFPPLCILLVQFPAYHHSVVYYEGTYYDPEFGILERYNNNGKITHYMEIFIEEVYMNKQIKLKIPNDFKEAFENNQEAYESFKKLTYPQQSKCINGISHFKSPAVRKNNIEKIMERLNEQSRGRSVI